jgi:hypothetical protein
MMVVVIPWLGVAQASPAANPPTAHATRAGINNRRKVFTCPASLATKLDFFIVNMVLSCGLR